MVGPVSIGASAQPIYSAFRGRSRLVDLALEGYLTPALELSFPETRLEGGVVAELVPRDSDLVVWRIAVTNPNVRTEKGIGVGSSVAELRSLYRITGVGSGEGRVFVRVDELAASFELDRSGAGGDRLWKIRDPEQLARAMLAIHLAGLERFDEAERVAAELVERFPGAVDQSGATLDETLNSIRLLRPPGAARQK